MFYFVGVVPANGNHSATMHLVQIFDKARISQLIDSYVASGDENALGLFYQLITCSPVSSCKSADIESAIISELARQLWRNQKQQFLFDHVLTTKLIDAIAKRRLAPISLRAVAHLLRVQYEVTFRDSLFRDNVLFESYTNALCSSIVKHLVRSESDWRTTDVECDLLPVVFADLERASPQFEEYDFDELYAQMKNSSSPAKNPNIVAAAAPTTAAAETKTDTAAITTTIAGTGTSQRQLPVGSEESAPTISTDATLVPVSAQPDNLTYCLLEWLTIVDPIASAKKNTLGKKQQQIKPRLASLTETAEALIVLRTLVDFFEKSSHNSSVAALSLSGISVLRSVGSAWLLAVRNISFQRLKQACDTTIVQIPSVCCAGSSALTAAASSSDASASTSASLMHKPDGHAWSTWGMPLFNILTTLLEDPSQARLKDIHEINWFAAACSLLRTTTYVGTKTCMSGTEAALSMLRCGLASQSLYFAQQTNELVDHDMIGLLLLHVKGHYASCDVVPKPSAAYLPHHVYNCCCSAPVDVSCVHRMQCMQQAAAILQLVLHSKPFPEFVVIVRNFGLISVLEETFSVTSITATPSVDFSACRNTYLLILNLIVRRCEERLANVTILFDMDRIYQCDAVRIKLDTLACLCRLHRSAVLP